jgi:hypothetical protein
MLPLTSVGAGEFGDQALHYTLTLPDDWEAMTPQRLDFFHQVARQHSLNVKYATGFCRKGRFFEVFPYVLVESHPYGMLGLNYDDLERALDSDDREKHAQEFTAKLADIAESTSLSRPVMERSKNRYLASTLVTGKNGIKVKSYTATIYGMEGTISVHCFAEEQTFDKWQSTFDGILDSFRYDSGYEFVPSEKRPSGPTEAQRRNLESTVYWLVPLIVVVILRVMWKRRRLRLARALCW